MVPAEHNDLRQRPVHNEHNFIVELVISKPFISEGLRVLITLSPSPSNDELCDKKENPDQPSPDEG